VARVAAAVKTGDDQMIELFGTVKVNDIQRDGKTQRGFRYKRWRESHEHDPGEIYDPGS
jgi:hypothetical protein